ncbi:MAG: hypothetical protein GY829_15615 [Gammaproteobacteria bacterium]|nr:hypothetical protein [Gammaproteobacteria bacterium]
MNSLGIKQGMRKKFYQFYRRYFFPFLFPFRSAVKRFFYLLKLSIYRLSGREIIHLLHIRKTAGSALKKALLNDLISARYKIELHQHSFRLCDVPPGDKVIFVTRDPVSRYVSGFYSRQRMGKPRYHIP